MRRAMSRNQQASVSLFPFLAVLICTMGALIVLLVLVVKQAEVQAHEHHTVAAEECAGEKQRLQVELEDQEFLREALKNQRPGMTQQLAEQRLRLSHLEDHIRQLAEQARRLEKQLNDVDQIEKIRSQDRRAMQDALANVRAEIEAAQQQLELAQARAARQRRSFAIVPYDGPNGTRRRPIYVECTAEAVVIQPEGVALHAGDFRDPLIPGNPLDAALLAVREYLSRSGILSATDEPYPLLIVRPSGATSYAKARSAMKSWDDEFGYELIGAEMQLQYPPADEQLEQVIRQAIEEARRRHAALAAAQPSRFQGNVPAREKTVLRASPHGGFTREQVPADVADSPRGTGTYPESSANERVSSYSSKRSSPFGESDPANDFQSSDQQLPLHSADPQNREGPIGFSGRKGEGQGDIAQSRGADWALPAKSPGATAYTRPIRVVCFADRLVIVPTTGSDQPPLVTAMGESTRESMSSFVASIWQHMESWGIAGRSAYWKPILNVEVRTGGERRYAEMEVLLNRSGLVVQRSNRTP